MTALLPHKQEIQQQVPITSSGKKWAVPHGHRSLFMEFVSHSQAPNTSSSIPDSCLYHREDRTMTNKPTGFSKCTLYPLHTSLYEQWLLSNYNMMLPPNKLCSKGLHVEHFSPGVFQNFCFALLSHV